MIVPSNLLQPEFHARDSDSTACRDHNGFNEIMETMRIGNTPPTLDTGTKIMILRSVASRAAMKWRTLNIRRNKSLEWRTAAMNVEGFAVAYW
jgi:hypothetical protein